MGVKVMTNDYGTKELNMDDHDGSSTALGWPVVTHPSQRAPSELHPTKAEKKSLDIGSTCKSERSSARKHSVKWQQQFCSLL